MQPTLVFPLPLSARDSSKWRADERTGQNQFPSKILGVAARIVVKLSGEALMGTQSHGLDRRYARPDRGGSEEPRRRAAVEVAVVVGGREFFRGIEGADKGIERARADSIGMLATVMNALALRICDRKQRPDGTNPFAPCRCPPSARPYSRQAASCIIWQRPDRGSGRRHRQSLLTTDTGAALRGAELSCDLI